MFENDYASSGPENLTLLGDLGAFLQDFPPLPFNYMNSLWQKGER